MLGKEVKRLRLAVGKTQDQLAEALGVSQGFVQKLEAGLKTGFSPQVLYKLSDSLGVGCDHWRSLLPPESPRAVTREPKLPPPPEAPTKKARKKPPAE